jgi:hypothetical protein
MEVTWLLGYSVLGEKRSSCVRLMTGAKLVIVERVNSCVELSKTYFHVSYMNFSAVFVWREIISHFRLRTRYLINSFRGHCQLFKERQIIHQRP